MAPTRFSEELKKKKLCIAEMLYNSRACKHLSQIKFILMLLFIIKTCDFRGLQSFWVLRPEERPKAQMRLYG